MGRGEEEAQIYFSWDLPAGVDPDDPSVPSIAEVYEAFEELFYDLKAQEASKGIREYIT